MATIVLGGVWVYLKEVDPIPRCCSVEAGRCFLSNPQEASNGDAAQKCTDMDGKLVRNTTADFSVRKGCARVGSVRTGL